MDRQYNRLNKKDTLHLAIMMKAQMKISMNLLLKEHESYLVFLSCIKKIIFVPYFLVRLNPVELNLVGRSLVGCNLVGLNLVGLNMVELNLVELNLVELNFGRG